MKVGIIGCGLIGRKRALSICGDVLVGCCDTNSEVGNKFSKEFNCTFFDSYKDLINESEIVIISVINKYAKKIVNYTLKKDKYVLVEKPMGRNLKESISILKNSRNRILKVGFNHRFHPSILKAKEIFDSGRIGKLMFIRGIYGHGGRQGMENEWRSSKKLCGGGELLDQGVHLIDLSRWFAGDIVKVFGKVYNKFWNIEVEDNAFLLLESKNKAVIQLTASWTNWKNTFQFEIFGTDGYLKINGLGGSYGKETLEFGIRNNGVPDIEKYEFEIDDSWVREWQEFKMSIKDSRLPLGNVIDGLKANKIIKSVYKSSKKNKVIKINEIF